VVLVLVLQVVITVGHPWVPKPMMSTPCRLNRRYRPMAPIGGTARRGSRCLSGTPPHQALKRPPRRRDRHGCQQRLRFPSRQSHLAFR
jgi:hypothetical protein